MAHARCCKGKPGIYHAASQERLIAHLSWCICQGREPIGSTPEWMVGHVYDPSHVPPPLGKLGRGKSGIVDWDQNAGTATVDLLEGLITHPD